MSKSHVSKEKINTEVKEMHADILGNIKEFNNLSKENQNEAKEFNIGSNKVVLEINEYTTKYKVSRAN